MRYFFVVLPPPLFTMAQAHWPNRAAVPREVLKWLQSLDLSFSPINIRRDFSNGYLVAEVFSCYYPNDFQNHSYDNGTSLPTKTSNWTQIEKSLQKLGIRLPRDVIEGTIHCKPRAAEILIQEIYVLLTNRRIQSFQDAEADFTDRSYQEMLPMVARATASRAIKSNLRLSEVIAEPSIEKNRQKVTAIIGMHLQQRRAEKVENPERFNIKPTLGELAVRLPPASDKAEGALSDSSQQIHHSKVQAGTRL
ncbi:spermatogenesis-associated protein 4 isoform X2 [Brienomyrus brachyistius]|uniref:spermatogenesis-associated protein 4 isoform X2 n=1 Tax=Brienomyrus brachyistius TaxID=42636 RepID=UPI0020B26692|nr:spermatogenesis-associated protein 4 isoform X2 [Brienomyrus brachyistius]